jgi:hypothetical protein
MFSVAALIILSIIWSVFSFLFSVDERVTTEEDLQEANKTIRDNM